MIEVSTSILNVEKGKEAETFLALEKSKTDYFHIDVMDGEFVPNITFGMPVIKAIRNKTNKVFDVHLMINNPQKIGRAHV